MSLEAGGGLPKLGAGAAAHAFVSKGDPPERLLAAIQACTVERAAGR